MLLLAESPDLRHSLFEKFEGIPRVTTEVKGTRGYFPDLKRYQVVLLQIIPLQPSSCMQTSNNYQRVLQLTAPNIALRKQPVATNKHPILVRGQCQPRCIWESCPIYRSYVLHIGVMSCE